MEITATPITKVEAAHRQLRAAIRLFFNGGDMLAVHTITGAAFQLFADIGKVSGVVSRYRSDHVIRSETLKEWNTALNMTQNFLKHADRDVDSSLNYSEEATILFLYEAVELSGRVSPGDAKEYTAFNIWFISSFPEMIEPAFLAKFSEVDTQGLDQTDRTLWAEFLNKSGEA